MQKMWSPLLVCLKFFLKIGFLKYNEIIVQISSCVFRNLLVWYYSAVSGQQEHNGTTFDNLFVDIN